MLKDYIHLFIKRSWDYASFLIWWLIDPLLILAFYIFRFTYELECYRNSLEIKEFYPEKNPHECKIKKEYGNKAYQDGKDIDALHFYTQAVLSAPCDEKTGKSKDLAIVLANRSAVLFSLKAYHLSLDDIKLAFDSGYPEELHFKLLERKAKIL